MMNMLKPPCLIAVVLGCIVSEVAAPIASAGVSGKQYDAEVTLVQTGFPTDTFDDRWEFREDGTLLFFSYLEGKWSEIDLGPFSIWSTTYTNGPGIRYQYVGFSSGTNIQGFGVLYEISLGNSLFGVSSVTGTEATPSSKTPRSFTK